MLRTTRAFSYGGKRLKAGDPIEVKGRTLRLFQAIGFVEYGEDVPEQAAPVAQEEEAKPRRRYRRRDMQAGE